VADQPVPKGVAKLLVTADGHKIAYAASFEKGSPSGFSERESQEILAKDRLALAMLQELVAPRLLNCIDVHLAKLIMDRLCKEGGCRVLTVPIGYEADS
jgi:hypothetical protein